MKTRQQTVGEWLIEAREAMGSAAPSYRRLSSMLFVHLGDYAPSDETLRRWHRPEIENVDLATLTHLAEIYGRRVSELPGAALEALGRVQDSLVRNACS